MTEKQKKSMLIGSLLAVVVLMAIAYSAFASNLTITGTGSVSSNWCIGFDSTRTSDYQATAGISGGTVPTGSMAFSGDSCGSNYKTTASLNASFKQPGDKVEYTLTIGNKGTLAAAIESINVDNQSVTSDTTITKGNIKYIIEMPASTSLAVNATTTMKVTAMFQNDTEVSGSGNEQQTISVSINAIQDDGNGGFTPTANTFTGTIYRHNGSHTRDNYSISSNVEYQVYAITNDGVYGHGPSDKYSNLGDCQSDFVNKYHMSESSGFSCQLVTINADQTVDIGEYTTNAASLNKKTYIKHEVIQDVIINTELCFVYNNSEHCLKGGDNGAAFNTNKEILEGYQAFNNLSTISNPNYNNPGCNYGSSLAECYGGELYYLDITSYGFIRVSDTNGSECRIEAGGIAECLT